MSKWTVHWRRELGGLHLGGNLHNHYVQKFTLFFHPANRFSTGALRYVVQVPLVLSILCFSSISYGIVSVLWPLFLLVSFNIKKIKFYLLYKCRSMCVFVTFSCTNDEWTSMKFGLLTDKLLLGYIGYFLLLYHVAGNNQQVGNQ